jgi:hypothetical protein
MVVVVVVVDGCFAKRLVGTGVPESVTSSTAASVPTIGDGGASWRARALKRARERAEAEGRPLEEVVAERHNSSAELLQSAVAQERRDERRARDTHDARRRDYARRDDRHRHHAHDRQRFARPPRHDADDNDDDDDARSRRRDAFGRDVPRDRPSSPPPLDAAAARKAARGSAAQRAAARYAALPDQPAPLNTSTTSAASATATTASSTSTSAAPPPPTGPLPDLNKLEVGHLLLLLLSLMLTKRFDRRRLH